MVFSRKDGDVHGQTVSFRGLVSKVEKNDFFSNQFGEIYGSNSSGVFRIQLPKLNKTRLCQKMDATGRRDYPLFPDWDLGDFWGGAKNI